MVLMSMSLTLLVCVFAILIIHIKYHTCLKHTLRLILLSGLFSASSTTEFTSREIIRCLLLAKDGINAVLLVFSLRTRLTDEEQSTLQTLKILFGSQIVDYMIVVFTNGDALDDGETMDDYLEDCTEFQVVFSFFA